LINSQDESLELSGRRGGVAHVHLSTRKLRSILLKDGRIPATEIEKASRVPPQDKVPLSPLPRLGWGT
jgi:hypothetical protein